MDDLRDLLHAAGGDPRERPDLNRVERRARALRRRRHLTGVLTVAALIAVAGVTVLSLRPATVVLSPSAGPNEGCNAIRDQALRVEREFTPSPAPPSDASEGLEPAAVVADDIRRLLAVYERVTAAEDPRLQVLLEEARARGRAALRVVEDPRSADMTDLRLARFFETSAEISSVCFGVGAHTPPPPEGDPGLPDDWPAAELAIPDGARVERTWMHSEGEGGAGADYVLEAPSGPDPAEAVRDRLADQLAANGWVLSGLGWEGAVPFSTATLRLSGHGWRGGIRVTHEAGRPDVQLRVELLRGE